MSFFNPEIPLKEKIVTHHPWEKYIKDAYASTFKYGHNSAKNPVYPPPKKEKEPSVHRTKFTVIGNRTTKEFIYALDLVKGLHKYRWRYFETPVIQAVTGVEWSRVWNELKIKYGGPVYCLLSQVAVLMNDQFLGGVKELKELVESKYMYYLQPDYYGEAVKQFSSFIKSSGRPCAYFQISIDGEEIGTMIFMLYSDIVPRTCENFLRLCKETKGGYSGTPVHRIVKDSWIQCGGFGLKDTELDCENFIVPHDRRGVLGMANDGRHVDCSTQFFVLLQPQPWMACKYVAFGQLIDGEETLKKIENVPEWYESPKQEIIMYKAGILNMDCHDIMINRGANKYIEGHIENLIALGELFYEALLEKVFLEADFRSLNRLQAEMAGEDATGEEAANNIRTTQRFIRKKEEIEKQLEKSQAERSGRATPAADKGENNDFDVEEYEYAPEEYSYKQTTAPASSIVVKPEKPFYIPLTDVPYPGEVDSTFDLKKLLQGDYCLEMDLDKDIGRGKRHKHEEKRLSVPSEIFQALFEGPSSESSSEQSIDSEEEREIKRYLQSNADRVSFAGFTVKAVAKSGKFNLFENQKGSDMITDEVLRKYRIAEEEYKAHRDKKVSISLATAPDTHREIKRRQTGFVRPEDLARIRQFQKESADDDDDDEDDEDDDDYHPYTRQVAISQPDSKDKSAQKKELKRRQTGFVRPADLEKLHIFSKANPDDEDEDDDEPKKSNADRVSFAGFTVKAVAKSGKFNLFENQKGSDMITDEVLRKYRIAEEEYKAHRDKKVSISLATAPDTHREIKRRQTGFVRPEDLARIRQFQKESADDDDDDEDDEDDDDYHPYTRQVAISQPDSKDKSAQKKELKRRQTGFVRPADLEKLHIFSKANPDDEDEDDDEPKKDSRKVSVQEEETETPPERPSVLARLYDEVDTSDLGEGPTLKSMSVRRLTDDNKDRNMYLTFSPSKHLKSTPNSREMYQRRSFSLENLPERSIDQVLLLQHGQGVYRKISSDYVRTIDHIEQKEENSIRSLEYARKRPAISVKDYQKKNREYQENVAKLSIEEKTPKPQAEEEPELLKS
uniref:PPIase cyclophilin-type domain-containing protein n=1 Tax=Heliothis virescens TaxID=7102 RepID=A0A2A4J2C9_HELVI